MTAQPDHQLRRIVTPVLRLAPLAQGGIGLFARRPAAALRHGIRLIDLEVQRGGVVEHQVHIEIEQVRDAKKEVLLDGCPVLLQKIHGPVQVMQLQLLRPRNPDLLPQPLLVAVQLRAPGAGPVGHHGEQRALQREIELARVERLGDDFGDPQPLPERLQHIEIAIGPGIDQPPARIQGHDLFRRTTLQDACGQAA